VTTFSARLKQLRWHQWTLLGLVLVYLIYIALSYLYLPGKLKQVVEADVSELVGRQLTVERFEYNPFDLSLRVYDFAVADKPDAPLLAWQQFYVNFTPWGSLFSWDIKFEAIQLDQPLVNIEKHGDRFNFSDIIDKFSGDEAAVEEQQGDTRIALEVVNTAINQGVFRFTDLSGSKPARSEMDDITIEVLDLYLATGDEHLNPFNITAAIPGGGQIKLAGEYRLDPLYVDTNVEAMGIELKEFSDFVNNVVPMTVTGGRLGLNAHVLVQQQQEDVAVNIDNTDVTVTELALDDAIPEPPMARINTITISGLQFDLLQQSLEIGKLNVDQVVLNQWLDADGAPRFQHLLVQEVVEQNIEAQQSPAAAEQEAAPWSVVVRRLEVGNSQLNFSDQNEKITRGHTVSGIQVALDDFTLTEQQPVPLSIQATLDEQGMLKVDGVVTLVPFSMQLEYGLQNLPLPSFSEYIELATYLRIEKGSLNLNGKVDLSTEGEVPVSSQLALEVNDFQAEDLRTGKPVIQFKQIKAADAVLETQSKQFKLAALTITEPNLLVEIGKDKQLNWATIARPDPGVTEAVASAEQEVAADAQQAAADAQQAAASGWNYVIGKVEINNGLTRFVDNSVSPVFQTGLHSMAFELDEVASNNSMPVPFSLTSKIDRYAPFNVKGTLDPIAKQPGFEFKSQLRGLELPPLSPYSAAFIAHNLESGKLNLQLDYRLHDRKLKGENGIIADQLYLGEKVPSEDAIDAPVSLGLALLRDVNGVIDLDVGVSGDLDDPGFSISGVILKAFLNVMVKAASSPFQLLGSLVGGSEDMGEIEFAAGFADLTDDSQQRLQKLTEALQQRPQLIVRFHGGAFAPEDVPVLKKLRIQDRVADDRKMSLLELREEAGDVDWWSVRANRKAMLRINDELKLPDTGEREDALQAQNPELKGDELEAAVYQAMYEDVADKQEITSTDLLALADARALVIKQYLVDVTQLDHGRVSVAKTKKAHLKGRVVKLGIDAR